MAYDTMKLKDLFSRVANNKIIQNDEQNDEVDIKEYCQRVFGSDKNPDPTLLHQFNNLVVETADEIAKPQMSDLLGVFATFVPRNRGDLYKYNIPQKFKSKVKWVANGTGIDAVRVDKGVQQIALPRTFGTAFEYEPLDVSTDAVGNFNILVNNVAEAKLKLYLNEVMALIEKAVTSQAIPANNVLSGSALTIAQYNKQASRVARYGGKPIFVADSLLIDFFANQYATLLGTNNATPDRLKEMFASALSITEIGRTTAVNLINPFIDKANTQVELPINKGYMFSSSESLKPFVIAEYGTMRQKTKENFEDDRIIMKITQDAAIEMLYPETINYIKEDSNAVSI